MCLFVCVCTVYSSGSYLHLDAGHSLITVWRKHRSDSPSGARCWISPFLWASSTACTLLPFSSKFSGKFRFHFCTCMVFLLHTVMMIPYIKFSEPGLPSFLTLLFPQKRREKIPFSSQFWLHTRKSDRSLLLQDRNKCSFGFSPLWLDQIKKSHPSVH